MKSFFGFRFQGREYACLYPDINYVVVVSGPTFDDLVVYIGGNELYGNLCEYLTLAVNNGPGEPTAYVRDANQGIDLGSIGGGNSALYEIISGTRIEIWSSGGGNGSIISSDPPTPIYLAGNGFTITIPP